MTKAHFYRSPWEETWKIDFDMDAVGSSALGVVL